MKLQIYLLPRMFIIQPNLSEIFSNSSIYYIVFLKTDIYFIKYNSM